MRKAMIASFIIMIFTILSGCKVQTPDRSYPSSFQTATSNETLTENTTITDSDGAVLIKTSIISPNARELVAGKPGEVIDAYYKKVYNLNRTWREGELTDLAREDRKQSESMGNVFRPYTIRQTFQTSRNDSEFLSILRESQTYTGGIHEDWSAAAETFYKSTGSLCTLKELFAENSNYSTFLITQIQHQVENLNQDNKAQYFDDIYALISQEFREENFFLTDSSLIIFYPAYSLTSYAYGVQYFEISLSELKNILA